MKVTLAAGSVEEGDPDSSTIPLFNYGNMEKALSEVIPELWQGARSYQEIEISLRFVNKAEMTSLNTEYRGVGYPTDVISFSLWEGEPFPDPEEWPILPLGDVVLCPSYIRENSGVSEGEELQEMLLMISHGILHLLGRDHANHTEKNSMWEEQSNLSDYLFRYHLIDKISEEGQE